MIRILLLIYQYNFTVGDFLSAVEESVQSENSEVPQKELENRPADKSYILRMLARAQAIRDDIDSIKN